MTEYSIRIMESFNGAFGYLVLFLCAGITGLHTARVTLYSLLSCFVWNVLLVSMVGENRAQMITLLMHYKHRCSVLPGMYHHCGICIPKGLF